jgi:hypothetical protein
MLLFIAGRKNKQGPFGASLRPGAAFGKVKNRAIFLFFLPKF